MIKCKIETKIIDNKEMLILNLEIKVEDTIANRKDLWDIIKKVNEIKQEMI